MVKVGTKNLTRRQFIAGAAALLGGTVAAACGGTPAPTATPVVITKEVTKVVEKQVTQVVEKPVTQVVEKSVEKIVTATPMVTPPATINVMHWYGTAFEQGYKTWPTFRAARPNVTLNDLQSPYSGYNDKLFTQLAAGTTPDVFMCDSFYNGTLIKTGQLLEFTPDLFQTAGVDLKKYTVDLTKSAGMAGKIYGTDIQLSATWSGFLNMDIVGKMSSRPPAYGTPEFDTWTWDKDWIPWLKEATKVRADGTVEQYGVECWGSSVASWGNLQMVMIVENGGTLFKEDDWWNFTEKEILLTSEPVMGAIQRLVDLILVHKVNPRPDATPAGEVGPFMSGKAAAWLYAAGQHVVQTTSVPFKMDTYVMPYQVRRSQQIGSNWWAVPKTTKVAKAAMDMAIFISTNAVSNSLFNAAAVPPAFDTRTITNSMAGWARTTSETWGERHQKFSSVKQIADGTWPVTTFPLWLGATNGPFIRDTLSTMMQNIVAGKATVKQACTDAKAVIDAKLKSG